MCNRNWDREHQLDDEGCLSGGGTQSLGWVWRGPGSSWGSRKTKNQQRKLFAEGNRLEAQKTHREQQECPQGWFGNIPIPTGLWMPRDWGWILSTTNLYSWAIKLPCLRQKTPSQRLFLFSGKKIICIYVFHYWFLFIVLFIFSKCWFIFLYLLFFWEKWCQGFHWAYV